MKNYKINSVKNKKIRIIGAIVCIIVLLAFMFGVVIGIIGGYRLDINLMRARIWTSIVAGVFMGILHILYFRTSEKFRKKLFGEGI